MQIGPHCARRAMGSCIGNLDARADLSGDVRAKHQWPSDIDLHRCPCAECPGWQRARVFRARGCRRTPTRALGPCSRSSRRQLRKRSRLRKMRALGRDLAPCVRPTTACSAQNFTAGVGKVRGCRKRADRFTAIDSHRPRSCAGTPHGVARAHPLQGSARRNESPGL